MYIRTIDEFLHDVEQEFQSSVLRVLEQEHRSPVSQSERRSWEESLPALAKVLSSLPEQTRGQCQIVLEAQYMTEENRADVVLVGTRGERPVLLLIENKRWSNLQRYTPAGENSVWDPFRRVRIFHPCCQVAHYRTTLEYTNQLVQDSQAEIHTMVYLQNGTRKEKAAGVGPFAPQYRTLYEQSPMFVSEETEQIVSFIARYITGGSPLLAQKIYSSPVQYSPEYQALLGNLFGNRKQLLALLDEEQIALFDEIVQAVQSGREKRVFLVQGHAGTGKTFVAVALLAYLYQNSRSSGLQVRYIEKNRDPRQMLEAEMGVPHQAIMVTVPPSARPYDCLICDESHRMPEQVYRGRDDRNFLDQFIKMGQVCVLFYDEQQSVHIWDYVTRERVLEAALRQRIPREHILERELIYQHRCKAADRFLAAMSQILDHPELGLEGISPFPEDGPYQAALVEDPRDLFQLIREKNSQRGKNHPSRVLAGKGRSFQKNWTWYTSNTDYARGKSIAPLRDSSQPLYTWNLKDYGNGVIFAYDEGSVELVGCIDTSQGLDFEYVGVIIAPDLIYDPTLRQVRVCLSGHSSEDPNTGRQWNFRYDRKRLERIIKNTYRVLLSRGERGCFIYCCDEALQNYLSQILPTKKLSPPRP